MTIGLKRGTVQLQQYDSNWAVEFENEKKSLIEALGPFANGIEHIGSTSVPGLEAKPLIDMIVPIDNLDDVTVIIPSLIRMGYEHMPERIFATRAFFPKGPREKRTHHLSFVNTDSMEFRDAIAFRDMLRSDEDIRDAYRNLKKKLAERYEDDRYAYTEAKQKFIEAVLERARKRT